MDHLQSCAKAFEHLLDFQYHIIIGRKGKSVELNILFDPTEIEPFIQIENFLDSNKLIFRYNQKLQTFSLIEAEYLLSTPYENTDIYIFLDRQKEPGHFFCRSPASDTFNKVPSFPFIRKYLQCILYGSKYPTIHHSTLFSALSRRQNWILHKGILMSIV